MDKDTFERLFNEDYRDPADDAQRLAIYALFICGVFGGIWIVVEGIREWVAGPSPGTLRNPATQSFHPFMVALIAVVGFLMSAGSAWLLFHESKRWKLKGLTWDKFIYGGIDLAFGIMWLGVEFGSGHPMGMFAIVGVGVAVLLLFMFIAIGYALWEQYRPPKTFRNVLVRTRFAVDDRLMEVFDHPCPVEDGLLPVVELLTVQGQNLKLKASSRAYENASEGVRGHAKVRGKTLLNFRPLLKSGQV